MSASADRTVKFWDVRGTSSLLFYLIHIVAKQAVATIHTSGENINIAYAPSSSMIVVGTKQDTTHFIDPRTMSISEALHHDIEVNEIKWGYSDHLLYCTTGTGSIRIYSYPEMQVVWEVKGHTANTYTIDFDPKGRYFVTGGADAHVCVFDIQEVVCCSTISRHEYAYLLFC